jgi:DNA-binding CsgD family transcriptional regulator/PAS domain-containing protein
MWGFDPGYVQAYFDEYGKFDPATASFVCAGIGEQVLLSVVIPQNEFLETRFYREWSRPQGLVDCINVPLDKSATSLSLFGVSRHRLDGVADDETCRRMRLLAPHIRRAVLIANATERKQAEASVFAETLDGLRAGMLLVDGGGRIMHANTSGRTMLAEGDILRIGGGRLASLDSRIDESLRNIFAAAPGGDVAVGTKGIALPLTARTGERYVAHVLPLTSGLRSDAGMRHTAVAALFVHKASLATPSPPEVIARSYRLTPTELRVLLAIVKVGGTPEVADSLGIAASTVKTHLSRIYEKTGTSRHADLVKLVAGFATPLLD